MPELALSLVVSTPSITASPIESRLPPAAPSSAMLLQRACAKLVNTSMLPGQVLTSNELQRLTALRTSEKLASGDKTMQQAGMRQSLLERGLTYTRSKSSTCCGGEAVLQQAHAKKTNRTNRLTGTGIGLSTPWVATAAHTYIRNGEGSARLHKR